MHKTHFLSRAMLLVFFVVGSLAGMAQVTLTATSGTTTGSFTTLKGAFDAINVGTHKGSIVIKINASTSEGTTQASLNASAVTSTFAPYYTSINIYPTTTGLSISGAVAGNALINLNGADNVTIDGRVDATGSTKSLTITNTSAVATAGTSTIRFIADASSNTVKYCTLKGSSTNASAGIVFFSTGTTTGNDNNTIDNNDITNNADARPLNAVFAQGATANNNDNTISNNNIYNFLSRSTASNGINISSNNSAFTISGNSFYETASFTASAAVNYNVILISAATGSGNGFTVSGNYIGGSAALCAGTAWTKTGTVAATHNNAFTAISVTTATGTANSIQGNTIQNFNWTNTGVAAFTGISLSGATVANIGTVTGNTIGAATGIGSITYTSSVTAANFYGINIASTDVVDCRNNTIGAITAANASTNATNFFGIVKTATAGTTTISNNTIGSTSTSSSINASSASSTAANIQSVYGIQSAGTGTVTISGNTVANMANATTNATVGSAGLISGIYVSAGTNTISGNTVRDLSNANLNTSLTGTASVTGIVMASITAAAQTVSGNTVHSLSNSNTSFAGGVIGIYYNGPTTASTVSRNFIHSLSVSSSSTLADLYGIKIATGATTYSNNIISLGGDTKTDIFGIFETGISTHNNSLYFNTVYISGSMVSGAANLSYALHSAVITNTRNFRNNVLVNARSTVSGTSKHYALYIVSSGGTITLGNNNYYVSGTGGVLGYVAANKTSLPMIASNDANSIVTNPTFSNAGGTTAANYTPTVPGTAVTGTGITVDYAGNTRATSVTMGALEVKLGPDAPTSLVATAGVRSASIAFTAPTNIGGGVITGYQYSLDNGVNWITPYPAVIGSPIFIEGLTMCTDYAIKIRAANATGGGTASAAVNVTTKNGQKAVTWTAGTSGADNYWRGIAFGNGIFVAVSQDGVGNRVMTSPDGITWTSRTSAADVTWSSVTYGNGLFVAVAQSGSVSTKIMTSPDGITWTLRTSPVNLGWNSVTYGNGLFVAVASSGSGDGVMTSPDGITWTSRTSVPSNTWRSVIYGNGLFVAVSSDGVGNQVMTSSDGITWTSRTSAADNGWLSITYGNDLFVAVSLGGTNRIMTSPDGITWTSRTQSTGGQGVTFGNGIFVFVTPGGSQNTQVWTSTDGITWTSRTAAANIGWNAITYANGKFVAVSYNGTGNRVMTSADEFAPEKPVINTITPRAFVASVAFSAPSSSGYSDITNYEYSMDAGTTWVTPSPVVTTSPQSISGLSSGTTYPTQLRAVNSMGSGCGSATINTTTLVPVVPNAPTGVVATSFINAASIAFTASTDDGGADITNYQYSLNNGASWVTPSPAVTSSPLFITGLTSCVDYPVKIRAVNVAGGGTVSDAITYSPPNGQHAGINWTSGVSAADSWWYSVAHGNGLFVAVSFYNSSLQSTVNSVMTSPDGNTWTMRTAATAGGWNGITYGNGLFVAVGPGINLMSSLDGINWTLRTVSENNSWSSVTYGNGLYVAVASNGTNRVMTSPDGITWTVRAAAAAYEWRSVTYGNGLYVAVASTGTGDRVMTSTDAINWTLRTSAADNGWWSVGYGNGLFVAVSFNGSGNSVMTSPDGITWTSRTYPTDMIQLRSVIYGNGLFAVAGNASLMTSPDGITWTKRTITANNWRSVVYGNGKYVAVSITGTGNRVMTSSDNATPDKPSINSITPKNIYATVSFTAPASSGSSAITEYQYSIDNGTNWVTSTATSSPLRVSGLTSGNTYQIQLRAVNSVGSSCASATVNITTPVPVVPEAPTSLAAITTDIVSGANISFVAPTNDGGADISSYEYTINDGAAWTSIPSTSSPLSIPGLTACTAYAIKIRAVNVAGAGAASSAVSVTPQNGQMAGLNWTSRASASDHRWSSVTHGSGLFVAVAYSNSAYANTTTGVMTSPDGITWTIRTSVVGNWNSITFDNGLFVSVGNSTVMTSPDGVTWTSRTSSTISQWTSVTYGNGLFVAVSQSGTGNRVMTSPNGITWTIRTSAPDNQWRSVTYGNGLFVAVANSGTGNRVMSSPDGITWTSRTAAADIDWRSVTYGNGVFVAVAYSGAGNRVMTSPDGITWTQRPHAVANAWQSVTYADGLFVAVSENGTGNRVMSSPDGITWTARTSAADKSWTSVTYGNGVMVAVSNSSSTAGQLMTSTDLLAPGVPTITGITPSATSASLAFTAPASSGYDAISNYQYSIDNGSSWVTRTPVSTASPLVISGLTSGTNYQIKLRAVNSMGSGCGSEAVSTCVNPTSGGTIAAAQSGASPFNPSAFTSSDAASGHTGTLEYKWQSSTTGSSSGFSDIASSNSDIYDAGSLTQTTWFKRLARVDCNSTWTAAAESNVLEVTIIPMASQPTAQPTALYFTTTGTNPYNFVGKFTASASATGYLVVRNTGSAPTFTPADGTEYTTGSQTGGVIVNSGALATFTESSVTSNVRYFYAIYAFNGSGSTTNYLTTSPLNGSALRSTTGSGSVPASATGTSVSFPGTGVTVNFPAGTSGTSLTVSKSLSAPSSNFQVNSSIRGKKPMYFTITSSSRTPGVYTLILDFSGLGPLTNAQWNSYKITKRKNARSPWVDITKLGATIVNRYTDGTPGKFTITGLSSFSEFGLDEVYDGVLTSNLDEIPESLPLTVTTGDFGAQAFVTDGIRYDLTKLKVSVSGNATDLRARLYGSNGSGNVNTPTILTSFNTPAPLSGNVYELTPQTPVKLEPSTQYWVVFYSANNPVDIDNTSSFTETGPAFFPGNFSTFSSNSGTSYGPPNTDPPALFSIEATEVTRTWTGGGSSADWNDAANWTPSEIPGNGEIMTIPNVSNDPVLGANISPANLIVESGTVLNMGDKNITLTQGFINDGSLTSTTGKLILAGTSAQGIVGTGSISRLEVNNIEGVFISGDDFMQTITGSLTPTAGTLTTNGNLTLKSSSAGTARVATGSASGGYIDGEVTVERYIPAGRKWRFLTAPLTGTINNSVFYNWQNNDVPNGNTGVEIWGPDGQADPSSANTGLAVGPSPSMRSYGSSGWASVTNTNTTLLFDGTTNYGFALFQTGPYNNGSTSFIGGPGNLPAGVATTLSATGNLITGDHAKNFTASVANQYFLVGNPYASPVDPRSFAANRTNINDKLWMWDAKPGNGVGRGLGRYVSFDLSSNAYNVNANGYADNNVMIQSGQAFFVQSTASGAASLVFRESGKDANGSHAMMGDEIRTPKALLRLTLQQPLTSDSTENLDGAVAVFHAEGKSGLDPLDGSKLMNSTENIFFRREARNLTFEHRPMVTAKDTLYLRMSHLMAGGSYRLQAEGSDFPDTDAVSAELIDRFTGRSVPVSLKGKTDHAFTVTADSLSTGDRFLVVFSRAAAPVVVTPDTDADAVGLKLYPNPVRNDLQVAVNVSMTGPFTIQVISGSGEPVWMRSGIASGTKRVAINTSGMVSGVYHLVLTDGQGGRMVKKFVKE